MTFYTDFTFFYRSVIVPFFFPLYDIEVKMREKRKSSHELGRLRQRKKNMTYKEIKKNEEVLAYLKKETTIWGLWDLRIIRMHTVRWLRSGQQ